MLDNSFGFGDRFTTMTETAHEHAMDHMRDLGDRLLHAGDFSYDDIT